MIDTLYSRHYQRLLGYCLSLTHSAAFAEDIVQDAFVRALANADLLGAMSEPKCLAWLYRTARNLFIDHVRRQKRTPRPEPDSAAEADYGAVGVMQIMNRLPERERALFYLRYFQGYNATELGDMFGMTPSTVRSRLKSARDTLRQCLLEQ